MAGCDPGERLPGPVVPNPSGNLSQWTRLNERRTDVEMLSFDSSTRHLAIEAAVHLARYGMARSVAQGKMVLDVACGEGYGAHVMAERWGADHVTGIDVSEEAIAAANTHFSSDKVEFVVGSAYELHTLVGPKRFNLITCFETIEHLDHPEWLLEQLLKVATPDAIFIISCPNDPYRYGPDRPGDTSHLRTYTADQFFTMVDGILGPCKNKFIGTPVVGFGNFAVGTEPRINRHDQRAMVDASLDTSLPSILVPPDSALDLDHGAYYIGVWSKDDIYADDRTSALYPCDMHSLVQKTMYDDIVADRLQELERKHAGAIAQKDHLITGMEDRIRRFALTTQALKAEQRLAQQSIARLNDELRLALLQVETTRAEVERIRIPIFRTFTVKLFRRIGRSLPAPMQRLIRRSLYGAQ